MGLSERVEMVVDSTMGRVEGAREVGEEIEEGVGNSMAMVGVYWHLVALDEGDEERNEERIFSISYSSSLLMRSGGGTGKLMSL